MKQTVGEQRQKLVNAVTEISVTQYFIRDQVVKIDTHLEKLNNRVGKAEVKISWLYGIFFLFGSVLGAVVYLVK
jgi:septation ring formation regulator EzrA